MLKYVTIRVLFLFVSIVTIVSFLFVLSKYCYIHTWTFDGTTNWEMFKESFNLIDDYWKMILYDWNWGTNRASGLPVWDFVAPGFKYTLAVNFFALIVYFPLGILLGTLSALYKDSLFDKLISTFTLVFGSIPIYISIDLLYFVVGYKWGWFPYSFPLKDLTPGLILSGFVIPTIALSSLPIARITRAIRDELVDSFEDNYILLARTKGYTHKQAILRHSFRNAIVPVLPQVFGVFYIVLNTSFLVELVYYIPGVAALLYESLIVSGDMLTYVNFDVGTVTLIGTFYCSISLLFAFSIDILSAFIDPRITYN